MKVNQAELAVWVVLAAFAYLYQKQLIAIVLEERKFLFIRNKTVYVKTRQATAPDLSGVEAVIFSTLQEVNDTSWRVVSNMYNITRRSIPWLTSNPWSWVLDIVKEHLVQRGIVKRVVWQGFFLLTHKYVVNGDLSQAEKQVTELQKTLEDLQAQGELYQQMISDIEKGFVSRESRGD